MAIGSLIISMILLQSGIFGKPAAGIGILAGIVTIVNEIGIVVAPAVAGVLMPINGCCG